MTVSEQIISVLDALCEKFGIVIDWSQQNVLPYVSELTDKLIKYEIATSIAWCVIMVVVTAILGVIFIATHKKVMATYGEYDPYDGLAVLAVCLGVGLGLLAIVTILVIGQQVFDIITCYTFPEKIILEYVKALMSSSSG